MHYPFRLTIVSLLFIFSISLAQAQSPFSTATSDSSIRIKESGGFIQAQFNQSAFKLGYLTNADMAAAAFRISHPDKSVRNLVRYGFELQATPSDNTASFFQSSNLSVGGQITASVGLDYLASSQPSDNAIKGFVLVNVKPYQDAVTDALKKQRDAKASVDKATQALQAVPAT
ncbi:MAG TPA: hypothetical protein VKU00_14645, partial [Chthonomonadaceae bacterium]|nr:hypothetical protein [Chthonomonadaceae bacterium]